MGKGPQSIPQGWQRSRAVGGRGASSCLPGLGPGARAGTDVTAEGKSIPQGWERGIQTLQGAPQGQKRGVVPGKSPVVGQRVPHHREPHPQRTEQPAPKRTAGIWEKSQEKKQWVRSKFRGQLCRGGRRADGQASTRTQTSFGNGTAPERGGLDPQTSQRCLKGAAQRLGLRGDPGGMAVCPQLPPAPPVSCPPSSAGLQPGGGQRGRPQEEGDRREQQLHGSAA